MTPIRIIIHLSRCLKRTVRNRNRVGGARTPSPLNPEQIAIVQKAKEKLTKSERAKLRKRECYVKQLAEQASSDEDGEPSQDKGKGVDPRNWANAGIDPEDMDVEAQ